jgi:rSAM/selenodomain-associated transferase 2
MEPLEPVKKKISIIIPVFNEAEGIDRTLRQFSHVTPDASPHEIIVVDGDAGGGTIRAISTPGIITTVGPRGRAWQMNHGASLASGEVLLFLHADTLLPVNALPKIAAALSGRIDAWGAFALGIASTRPVYRLIEAAVGIRTRLTRIPYGDQAIYMTKRLFHSVGGYPPIPIMEDVALVSRIKDQAAEMFLIPDKVSTSPRRWEEEGIVYCTLRNWLLVTCYFLGARPESLAKHYHRSK